MQTGREASADTALQSVLNNFKPLHSGYLIIKMIFAGLLFMEFCENFYKNLPNNIMTVLSDLTEKYTEEAGEERILC